MKTYLAEYIEGGVRKATSFLADSFDEAQRIAFFDGRSPVIVGRKTG